MDLTNDVLALGVPSSVAVERIRTSYLGLIADAAQALTGVPLTVELLVDTAPRPDERVAVDAVVAASGAPSSVGGASGTNPSGLNASDEWTAPAETEFRGAAPRR